MRVCLSFEAYPFQPDDGRAPLRDPVAIARMRAVRYLDVVANYARPRRVSKSMAACNCHNKDDIVTARQLPGENAATR